MASPLTPALSSLSAAASICCSRMCGTFDFCLGVPKCAAVMNKESGGSYFFLYSTDVYKFTEVLARSHKKRR